MKSEDANDIKNQYDDICGEHNFFSDGSPEIKTLTGIIGYRDESWKGDPRLVRRWGRRAMRLLLPVSVKDESTIVTGEELQQIKRDLRMPEKLETTGLFRMMNLGIANTT